MKAALLIIGAVAKITGKFELPGQLYRPGEYVNYTAVYNALHEHIIQANPSWEIDTFMHGWNQDLQEPLVSLYQPKAYRFDDNDQYRGMIETKVSEACGEPRGFSLASLCLTIKFGCELVEQYVNNTQTSYDLIIITRPDILVWKNFKLDSYNPSMVTLDNYQDYRGEMHFIMSYENMLRFKNLFDSISKELPAQHHNLFKDYLFNYMRVPVAQDDIVAGEDEAPMRYIYTSMIASGKIPLSTLNRYGITDEQAKTYTVIY